MRNKIKNLYNRWLDIAYNLLKSPKTWQSIWARRLFVIILPLSLVIWFIFVLCIVIITFALFIVGVTTIQILDIWKG